MAYRRLRGGVGRVSAKDCALRKGGNTSIRSEVFNIQPHAIWYSSFQVGTFSRGQEDNKPSDLAELTPSCAEEMGSHFLNNIDVGDAGRYTFTSKEAYVTRIRDGRWYSGPNITRRWKLRWPRSPPHPE